MTADEVKKIVAEHLLVNDVGGGYSAILDTRAQLDALECRICLLYTSPSPRDRQKSRMPSSA